jgi:hypothetical protein
MLNVVMESRWTVSHSDIADGVEFGAMVKPGREAKFKFEY